MTETGLNHAVRRRAGADVFMPWARAVRTRTGSVWGYEASVRYCIALARDHYENFPVSIALLGRGRREALAAVYAFARIADDFADEKVYEGRRIELLDGWERQIEDCCEGRASHPVFVALMGAMDRYGLGQRHFTGLLSAFRQDCTKRRYGTYDELLDYCSRSANPVGRLVLEILGVKGAGFVEASDCICTALQLANFWQDISVDAGKGRLYIPEEDLERFNVDGRSVMNGNPAGDFRSLVKFEVDRARGLMSRGFPLIAGCGYPGSIYLAAVWVGGSTILNEIEHSASTVGGRRPDLNAAVLVRRFPFADILRAMAGGGSA